MFLRHVSFVLLFGLGLFAGCCADDRNYIRDHIVRQNPQPVFRNSPPEHGTNLVPVLVVTDSTETAASK